MELHERIRELRKHHLHLSQTDFGQRLGVSLSVINNIELNRLARPDQKLSLMKLICKEFNVSEAWLMDGIEPMFAEPETFNLHDYAQERHLTDLELEIIKAYLDLKPSVRMAVVEHFKNRLRSIPDPAATGDHFVDSDKMADTSDPAATPAEKTVEELEDEYKKVAPRKRGARDRMLRVP